MNESNKYPLGEYVKVEGGYAFKSANFVDTGIPIIRISNLTNGKLDLDNCVRYPSETFDDFKRYLVEEGDILIAMSGATTGKVGVAQGFKGKSFLNQRVGNFKIKDTSKLNKKFLYYIVTSKEYQKKVKKIAAGCAQPNISSKKLEEIEVTIPPLQTQKKIVEILERAEKLKEWRVGADELTDEYLESVFLEMFGDPIKNPKGWKTLNGKEYGKKISVGVVVRPASYYVDEGVIALRSLNIKPNKIKLDDLVYFSHGDNENKLSKSILRKRDVVVVRTGVTGTAAVVPEELDGCNCIDLIIVRPNSEIVHPIYLSCFFNSENGKNLVLSKEVGGIQKHFNVGAIKNLEIPIPPIALQNQFAEIVQQVETLKSYQSQSKQEIDNLFNTLMQKAFKGELLC